MYRPNFCAECGERVVRARWRWWTSRRFCVPCARRFRRRSIAARLAAVAALLAVGFLVGRQGRPAPPPLVVERGELPLVAPRAGAAPGAGVGGASFGARAAERREPPRGADGTRDERPTEPDEVVSVCGARTQKGTPCQRRVRGTGRCWQHRGKAAMLPPSKLIVPN
jgi:hypothetical protein